MNVQEKMTMLKCYACRYSYLIKGKPLPPKSGKEKVGQNPASLDIWIYNSPWMVKWDLCLLGACILGVLLV